MSADPDDFVLQEFYCASSGGGCGGYITLPVNTSLNGTIRVNCPKCKHQHDRFLKNGRIVEEGRTTGAVHELCPTIAAWSKEPRLEQTRKIPGTKDERDAVLVPTVVPDGNGEDLSLRSRWFKKLVGKG